jgi:segregation and condensation protein B
VSPPWVDALTGDEPLSASDDGEPAASELPELSWPLSGERLTSVLESLLFASDKPLSVERIHELLEETAAAPHKPSGPPLYKPQQLQPLLVALPTSLEEGGRGIGLHEVAGGWQLRTAPSNAPWVQRMLKQKPVRLSRAQLEALAIVAYRQPITRPEIDDIRGVDSGASLRMLLDRGLIRILGKKEEPGRPLLYGTTREFLEFFNLKDLKDLPTLREYYDLTDESRDKVRAAGFEPPTPDLRKAHFPSILCLNHLTTAADGWKRLRRRAAAEAPIQCATSSPAGRAD